MFERNRIDHATKEAIACALTLDDGRELIGHLVVNLPRGIAEELNAPGGFVEFETASRERGFIAKRSIRGARAKVLPKADVLQRRVREGEVFDPHAVLGLPRTADREAIRQAYHMLAKAYHPDRLQGLGLPDEIIEYATAMAKRINAAYSALIGGQPHAAAQRERQSA